MIWPPHFASILLVEKDIAQPCNLNNASFTSSSTTTCGRFFLVKIADYASRTQDNRTIAARFLVLFHAKKWSQRIIGLHINFYGQLVADISPNNL